MRARGGSELSILSSTHILSCTNPECGTSVQINHLVGATPPNARDICTSPNCNASMVLDRILVKTENEGDEIIVVAPDLRRVASVAKTLAKNNTSRINNSPGGENILKAFTNRFATGLVILDISREIAEEDGIVELKEFLDAFTETSFRIKDHLRTIEDEFGISRGERLSDGFPVMSGPMKIALKAWIGCTGEDLVRNRGLLMELGALERVNARQFRIVENGAFSQLPNVKQMLIESDKPERTFGENKPYLGVFLPARVSTEIISQIQVHIPDEFHHMMYVLSLIKSSSNEEDGWDSNFYALQEIDNILNGNGHPRWGDRYEYYCHLARRKGEHHPEDFASNRMVTNINSTLGGLLGRMKELGLIYPIRSGTVKNVQITPFGEKILFEYEERDE